VPAHLLPGGSGFSGTLFKNRETGELPLSFRATEFAGDAVRESKATNGLEVKELGWASGQIASQFPAGLCQTRRFQGGANFQFTVIGRAERA